MEIKSKHRSATRLIKVALRNKINYRDAVRYKIYTLCVCFICLNSDCSSEERLIVKDISKPLIINTTTEISNDNNCLSLIKDYKLEFTDEKKQYFIDDPVAFYSSIKDILVKGTKLEIMLTLGKFTYAFLIKDFLTR